MEASMYQKHVSVLSDKEANIDFETSSGSVSPDGFDNKVDGHMPSNMQKRSIDETLDDCSIVYSPTSNEPTKIIKVEHENQSYYSFVQQNSPTLTLNDNLAHDEYTKAVHETQQYYEPISMINDLTYCSKESVLAHAAMESNISSDKDYFDEFEAYENFSNISSFTPDKFHIINRINQANSESNNELLDDIMSVIHSQLAQISS
jgi:hypothetical protein